MFAAPALPSSKPHKSVLQCAHTGVSGHSAMDEKLSAGSSGAHLMQAGGSPHQAARLDPQKLSSTVHSAYITMHNS